MYKKLGDQTVKFENPPRIKGFYSIVGEKEGQGPLKNFFDMIVDDAKFGENSWEKAESKFIETYRIRVCRRPYKSMYCKQLCSPTDWQTVFRSLRSLLHNGGKPFSCGNVY